MRVRAAALALLALAAAVGHGVTLPATAQDEAIQVVVLIHHPADKVDPFGVPFGDGDTFSARHRVHAVEGRFDYPTFVADGVVALVSVPDPNVPYDSTLQNYTALIRQRAASGSPGTMTLRGLAEGDGLAASIRFEPAAPLMDPQHDSPFRIMAAVVEDLIHYKPDARVSNGIEDHRFTVRALVDLGPADLASGRPVARNHTFPLGERWERTNLHVAAWVEATAPGRFQSGEVLQAAWAPANGTTVVQRGKAVLVEMYSATWCDPCLYGDLAVEAIAMKYGGAPPITRDEGARYFRPPEAPTVGALVAVAAAAAGLAWAASGRRRTA